MAKTFFADGDIVNKIPGTRLLAAFLNKIFSHRHDGGDVDGSAPLDYAVDSGAVNALVVALTPPLAAPVVGLPLYIKVAVTNTDAVTLALDGQAPLPLRKLGNVALVAADILAGQIIMVAYDGVNFQLLSAASLPTLDATTLQGQGASWLAPPGAKGEFFSPTVPAGWLAADGAAVLRAQYPALFAAISTTWGAGDGVTTFNLPDARGEFFRGWDNTRGLDADRDFGTVQKGTAVMVDLGDNALWSLSLSGSQAGLVDPAPAAAAFGYDLPSHDEYTGELVVNGAIGTTRLITGPEGQVYDANVTRSFAGMTRPRNIAVLVCIKY